jgi:non-homologous end joining protein Ku
MVRGYEVAKGQYIVVEDEEIGAVQIESTRTIDIDRFVPKNEIDERYINSPYYIARRGRENMGCLRLDCADRTSFRMASRCG